MRKYDHEDPKQAAARFVASLRPSVKKTIMRNHSIALKDYMTGVLEEGRQLTPEEEVDRDVRMREFMAIGKSFGFDEKQLTLVLMVESIVVKDGCDS